MVRPGMEATVESVFGATPINSQKKGGEGTSKHFDDAGLVVRLIVRSPPRLVREARQTPAVREAMLLPPGPCGT